MQLACAIFSLLGCLCVSMMICNVLSDIYERKQRVKRSKQIYTFNKLLTKLTKKHYEKYTPISYSVRDR